MRSSLVSAAVNVARIRRGQRRRLLSFGAVLALATPLFAGTTSAMGATRSVEDASVVSTWNALAVSTLAGDTTKHPNESFLYLGFLHAAIYDAVVGVKGRYEPYSFDRRAPRGTSATAAAAAAAHKILATYSPYARATLDTALATSLAGIPDPAKTKGVTFGVQAAQNLIDRRAHDGRNAPVLFTKPAGPGVWRPTPPALAPMAVPWAGGTTPLLARSATQFAPPAPPALTSERYTRDFAEVKAVGSATSTERTADQTALAMFFSGNAVVQINAALRDQAVKRGLNIVDSARMFAAVDMTVADAFITTWRAKLLHGLWRPSTAIQLADTDGNPATLADTSWRPLVVDPPYPEYPSGYNAVVAAASRALEGLFGRGHLDLTLISTAMPGAVRHYDSGRLLRADVVDARVWLGIHFRFADVAARRSGEHLADWTLDHYFGRVGDHRSRDHESRDRD